jgi:hypothetical protein
MLYIMLQEMGKNFVCVCKMNKLGCAIAGALGTNSLYHSQAICLSGQALEISKVPAVQIAGKHVDNYHDDDNGASALRPVGTCLHLQ